MNFTEIKGLDEAYVLQTYGRNQVAIDHGRGARLYDPEGREYARVECDAPVWGIWSHPDSSAGYVCLEPWYGICDFAGYEGELKERPHIQTVMPGETWTGGSQICF